MSAKEARHASQQGASANRHRHSDQSDREHCFREIERLLRENEDLRRKVAEREKQVADAEKQIADLERQLAARKKNSTNSSKPPSSDGLAGDQRPRGRKHKSKRKPGAQPGHAGHHRQLVPAAEVSAIEVLLPKQCGHCGGSLPQTSARATTEGEPRRHQVTEVPPVKAHITEYQFPNVRTYRKCRLQRACETPLMPEAALSISPFERCRWRLRRAREPMGKAAEFRLVFGRMIESSATADWVFDSSAGGSRAEEKASKGWK
jgi:hypothetical protein